MLSVKFELPNFTLQDALRLADRSYGLHGEVRPLPSERDQNFYFRTESGSEFVLKIANAAERREVLDLQNSALEHLARHAASVSLPRLCRTVAGESIAAIEGTDGTAHFMRLLTYVPGKLLAQVNPHTKEILRSLGLALGTIDGALQDFAHPAAQRELKWDLKHASWIRDYVHYIGMASQRAIVERFLSRFDLNIAPALATLRTSVIYNDANDYNVIIGQGDPWTRKVIGVIDFGDMLHSYTVGELAVAAAYAMLDKSDPLTAAADIVAGYHQAFALTEHELELLYPLIRARLCISVTNSAYQRQVEPDNEYLVISERPAWALLERLEGVSEEFALCAFRHACGLAPSSRSPAVVEWLEDNADSIGRVVEPDLGVDKVAVLDLSFGSRDLGDLTDLSDVEALTRRLFGRIKAVGARVGVGKYNEARPLYTSELFRAEGNDGSEWRTVHLGLDLFMRAGSEVFAPLHGRIHSFCNNAGTLDYGPTIILEHNVSNDAPAFFTLYGHLSEDSLEGLYEGKPVKQGERIARIGNYPINGGWPPHLHFQIIVDMLGRAGEFPGVALPGQRDIWLSLSPDPNLITRIPEDRFPSDEMSAQEILDVRDSHLSPALSISYNEPLKIVRGVMQYLYDENGRTYLDAVNNVAHVGHCHPRVVRAGQEQMAVLNTNTRYLHEGLARYAERLCSTLPEPLRVCFFVCSGSEANELALRLARSHTRSAETIVIDAGYHGNTTSLIEISSYKFDGPGGTGAPPHVHKVPMPDLYRGQFKRSDPLAAENYTRHVSSAIEQIEHDGGRVGAFICESLLGCGGQIVLPDGYLEEVYQRVRKAGGVCIADEVQVGFGRVGSHFWGFETQRVVPDIVTMGKPIGNGHPLGAVVTTPEIAASFSNSMEYFNTFGGNPVSCAIGLAVLDVIESERLQENALKTGTRLMDELRDLMEEHPLIGDVRGLGLFVGIELVLDRETLAPAADQANYVVNRMKQRGILLSTDGPFHNVIKIKPPLVFTGANADFLVSTLDKILAEDFLKA